MLLHFAHTFLICALTAAQSFKYNSSFTPDHIHYLKSETKALFNHAWDSYMEYGFPFDEVRPITCEPYGPDFNNYKDTVRNDALGNTSLTILDNLDTLIIMEEWEKLDVALGYLRDNMDTLFEQDTVVQVFEMSIRSLGGLLSAHLLLTDVSELSKFQNHSHYSQSYDGFLLKMAYDLGKKIIPAYKTINNVPLPRVNLKRGVKAVPSRLQEDACTAGAITPVLELSLLSRLTGDPEFEHYTEMTFWRLWSSKLSLNMLPMTIDPIANKWKDAVTGIGASVDSFYEYCVKASIVLDDPDMWKVFKTSYKALLTHLAQGGGENDGSMYFPNVGIHDGVLFSDWIDLLSAFWPGLQVLAGQLKDAIQTHWMFLKIWDKFELIPERWMYSLPKKRKKPRPEEAIALEWYPLRPEFIESSYYLYRATKDPMYLQIGARVLELLQTKYKAKCGLHGLQDVRTGEKQNRMETFVMGETLKYLYLLFDTYDNSFLHANMNGKNWVFSTEAHPLWLPRAFNPTSSKTPRKKDMERVERWFSGSKSALHFKDYNLKRRKLLSPRDLFVRNTTLPLVPNYKLPPGDDFAHVVKRDPFIDTFETCELNPFKYENEFLVSGLYQWDHIFSADNEFQKTLIKPKYLSSSSLDGSSIELTQSFYEKYSMMKPKKDGLYLQSPLGSTSLKYEVFIGNIQGCNTVEVSKLVYNSELDVPDPNYVFEGDLWIPEIQSLRVKFEELKPGAIDSSNTVITEDYIRSIVISDNSDLYAKPQNYSVLRITKVNGVQVKKKSIIWTLPFMNPGEESQSRILDMQSDGRVVLEGTVIENLVVANF